ncbi:MAG TPA: heparin lyase I family protein [Polyangiaceae bacterium]
MAVQRSKARATVCVALGFASLLGGCNSEILLGARPAGNDASTSGDGEAKLDAPSGILWFADHETGDLSQWHAGGDAMGGEYQAGGTIEISSEQAHGGSYSVKMTIDTSDAADHTARVYRRAATAPAYYSAWFYFSEAHTPDVWWSIFLIRSQDPNNLGTYRNLWDVNLERPGDAAMIISFYDHIADKDTLGAFPKPVPVGQWIHFEAFFSYAPPNGTRLTFWQDGDPVLDLMGLGDAPSPDLYWAIGNGANNLTPPISTLYIDDAVIATTRVGP